MSTPNLPDLFAAMVVSVRKLDQFIVCFSLVALTYLQDPPNEEGSFALFPKLTLEMRSLIWEATFRLQLVTLGWSDTDWWRPSHAGIPSRAVFDGPDHTPIALRISKESRSVALRHYKPILRELSQRSPIYFNFALDTIDFEDPMREILRSFYRFMPGGAPSPPPMLQELCDIYSQLKFVSLSSSTYKNYNKFSEEISKFENLKGVVIYTDWLFPDKATFYLYCAARTADNIAILKRLHSHAIEKGRTNFTAPTIKIVQDEFDRYYRFHEDKEFGENFLNLPAFVITGTIRNGLQPEFGSLVGRGYKTCLPEWTERNDESVWNPATSDKALT